jgi:hypothetical protein
MFAKPPRSHTWHSIASDPRWGHSTQYAGTAGTCVWDMPAQALTPVAISQMSTPKAYTSAAAQAVYDHVSMSAIAPRSWVATRLPPERQGMPTRQCVRARTFRELPLCQQLRWHCSDTNKVSAPDAACWGSHA